MTTMNPLATLKEISCIEWRIHDAGLDPRIKAACIRRSLDNLIDTTAPARKFHGIIGKCRVALDDGDTLDLLAGLALLRSMIPITWGMVPAGTLVTVGGVLYRKNKIGRVEPHSGTILPHFPANTVIREVNEQ